MFSADRIRFLRFRAESQILVGGKNIKVIAQYDDVCGGQVFPGDRLAFQEFFIQMLSPMLKPKFPISKSPKHHHHYVPPVYTCFLLLNIKLSWIYLPPTLLFVGFSQSAVPRKWKSIPLLMIHSLNICHFLDLFSTFFFFLCIPSRISVNVISVFFLNRGSSFWEAVLAMKGHVCKKACACSSGC